MRRRRNLSHSLEGGEEESELNLTPYLDIITTLVIFMIFTFQVVIEYRLIDVMAPEYSSVAGGGASEPQMTVTLVITKDGYRVLSSDPLVAPTEVPRKGDGKYDVTELRSALKRWKSELSLGESLVVIAEEATEYQVLVEAMDAVRNDGERLLFPDVVLATVGG